MKTLRNKRVTKLTVKDLKNQLKYVDDDTEVVIGLYRKNKPVDYCYLADIYTSMKYDSVLKEKLYNNVIVELVGYDHKYCTYTEKEDD